MKKFLILVVLVAACGGNGGETGPELVWVEETPPNADVFLRLVTLDEQSLTLEVVGNGITDLYGLAFRLYYDPEVLDFTEMTPATAWPADSISAAHETTTGTLVAAITNRGPSPGLNFPAQVLATLRFRLLQEARTPIEFVPYKCALVDTNGVTVSGQTWSGGALELR